jgi:tetratricopeptide (TPR) repeat protein
MQEVQPYIDAGLQLLAGKPLCYEQVAFLNYRAFWYIRQLETTSDNQKIAFVEQALARGREALCLAEELNDPATLSLTLDAMSFIYSRTHKYEEAHRLQHRRQLLEKQLTDREELYDLYMSLGYVHEQVADYPTALMWFGRAWSNAQTMESPALLLNCMVGRMRAWRQWNRWDNAYLVAHDILRLIEQYQQDEKRQLWALETLATIAYRRGQQEEGDHYTHQYKRLLDQQAEQFTPEAQAIHATSMHAIHLAREDWAQATDDYKEKLRHNEAQPSPEVVSTLAELFVITGESSELQASTCERAITLAEETGARKSVAVALRARGRMYLEQENWKLAEADLRHALHRCEVLDLPWERANTLYQLGLLYRRRADSTGDKTTRRSADLGRARYHFEQALGFFESLKAAPSVERVRQMLAQSSAVRI